VLGRLAIMIATIWGCTKFFPGILVSGGFLSYLWIVVLFSIINAILEIPHTLLSVPLGFLPPLLSISSLAVLGGAINGGLLLLISHFSSSLSINGFGWAFLAGLVISVVRFFISPSAM